MPVYLDGSRLARNNADWHRLLELCGLFGTLLADAERLYDPQAYHDRLLLGLSGIMSEAELHHLKMRLHSGARNKAARGELRRSLPVGLSYLPSGNIGLNPDEEVEARLHLVFSSFAELGSAHAVVRYLRRHDLPLPSRPLRGPSPHAVIWDQATSESVLAILHNPAYAGAYVYGRSTRDPARARRGRPGTGVVDLPMDRWPVLLHDRHPAYISWETFMPTRLDLKRITTHMRRVGGVRHVKERHSYRDLPRAHGAEHACTCITPAAAASTRSTSAPMGP